MENQDIGIDHIRKAAGSDLDEIMDIWLQSNLDTHTYIPETYWLKNYDDVREAIAGAKVIVYDDQGIKGFAGLQNMYLAGIFVKKEYRSKGIGHLLISCLQQELPQLILSVYEKNKSAISFYRNHGFEIMEQDVDPETHESEYLMRWNAEDEAVNGVGEGRDALAE